MALTFPELKQKLAERYDVLELTEFFEVTPEELVEMFEYKIEEKYEQLQALFEEDNDDDSGLGLS